MPSRTWSSLSRTSAPTNRKCSRRLSLNLSVRYPWPRVPYRGPVPSRNNAVDHIPVYIRQPEIAACVAVGEAGVVQAKQVQDSGMQIVEVDLVLHGVVAIIVSGTVLQAGLSSAAG